ncbi:class I SAM-dependent methyltransferase [Candidatus Gracilibacteria bacterium]|nr:class I SAM-dependent methyltransferase [Candidatus Gracilibacteria bacterium]
MIPKRIFKTAPTPQTKFIKADAEKLPLPDNSVDFAYSVGLLRYLKDPLRALEEGYRVLKPGGVFLWLLSGYTDISTKPTIEKILEGTPGASGTFRLCFGWSRMRGTLICKKSPTSKFTNFPFKLSNSFPKTIKTQLTDEFLEHRVYKKVGVRRQFDFLQYKSYSPTSCFEKINQSSHLRIGNTVNSPIFS